MKLNFEKTEIYEEKLLWSIYRCIQSKVKDNFLKWRVKVNERIHIFTIIIKKIWNAYINVNKLN